MRKFITHGEWQKLFNAITGEKHEIRDKTMLQMAYIHGLRVSELIDLKTTDIDLSEKVVFIKRLKNGFSTAHPIQSETFNLLKKWLKIRDKYIKGDNVEYLFLTTQGGKISRQWIYKLCIKYGKRAGLNIKVHPHMLRHACGFALANQGLDTRLIQDYLGHRNIHHTVLYTASNANRFQRAWKT
ncbi:tyrosine-type DNA invertase [Hafnia alvei]|uniref:tyrosine-type DNA invertase n=1 Tax=Hafnia alvei TaxID=569 RepID=UPI0014123491|nr:tyrosine-type DNA invertase [Hafnia alvei]QIP58252.1 tyrosine-type recombinase/integrase [Hafnia alvei]